MLSQHLGTLYDCSPGPPRSSPPVFLRLASLLVVSPGSPGVPGCVASAWGLYDCLPGPPRSSPLVFLVLASLLAVSPDSPGDSLRSLLGPAAIFATRFFTSCFVARCLSWLSWGPRVLSQHLGPSTIAPRASRDLRRWLFTDFLARWLVGPHLVLPPLCSKHTGKIAGIYPLLHVNDLANIKAARLSHTAYDFTLVCLSADILLDFARGFSWLGSPGA